VDAAIIDEFSAEVSWEVVERFAELEQISGPDDERKAAAFVEGKLDRFGIGHEILDPELYLTTPLSASIETDTGWASDPAKTVSFSKKGTVDGDLIYIENNNQIDSIAAMLSVLLDGLPDDLLGKVVLSESITQSPQSKSSPSKLRRHLWASISMNTNPTRVSSPLFEVVPLPKTNGSKSRTCSGQHLRKGGTRDPRGSQQWRRRHGLGGDEDSVETGSTRTGQNLRRGITGYGPICACSWPHRLLVHRCGRQRNW